MRNLFIGVVASVSLTGCVYYECTGDDCSSWSDDWDEWDCGDDPEDPCWDDTATDADDTGEPVDDDTDVDTDVDTDEDTEPCDPDPFDLYLNPAEAEQGSAFIASIRAGVATDLTQVVAVHVNGDVEVGALDARAREVVLFLQVEADADLGPQAVFATFADGDVIQLAEPLVIHEAGSGHAPGTSDDGSLECE